MLLGIIAFVFISFVVLRDTHPRRSVDFGPMARFLGMYYGQLFLMLIFSFVWWVVADNKDKRPFDFTDSTKIPFKNSKDNEE